MRLITNIVLVGNNGSTSPYVAQLLSGDNQRDYFIFQRTDEEYPQGNTATLFVDNGDEQSEFIQRGNEWYEIYDIGTSDSFVKSTVRLYFPQFSVDTYLPNATYMIDLYTHIHGIKVELGCYKFKRTDALACPPARFSGMDEYYEYIDFEIIDPFYLHYDDETEDIRTILGEPQRQNNTGSLLSIDLNVVEEGDGCYIKKEGWTGGQNNIFIFDPQDIKLQANYNVDDRTLDLNLNFNEEYDNLFEYIKETYGLTSTELTWEYVIMGQDDVYYEQSAIDTCSDSSYVAEKSFDITENDIFTTWDNWKEGLIIQGSLSMRDNSLQTNEQFLTVFSGKIPLSQELFSIMLHRAGYNNFPEKINFDDTDMNNINLTAINTIKTEVQIVQKSDNNNNHIIQPIFYQTRTLNNVVIHPSVTENITLNLNAYKSRVKEFMVQIEGVSFPEIGRTNNGIVFKISGNMLPKEKDEGTLYIINQDKDLVTTGKYTYSY